VRQPETAALLEELESPDLETVPDRPEAAKEELGDKRFWKMLDEAGLT
jgi:hypothetical protein